METKDPIVLVEQVNKSFGTNHVLRDFSMAVETGENLVILGKSGSGKSVLIKCIIKLIAADSGKITVLGQDIDALEEDQLNTWRADIGFLFQSNALYDSMTIRENLLFPLRRHWTKEKREKMADQAILEALEDVGLAHTLHMMPAELSGGMRKRVALARALILRPKVILYDEPTTGLDPITGKEISQLMIDVQKKYNATSIVISHDLKCINMIANRIIMLIDGKNYASGTFQELEAATDPKIKAFFE